MNIYLTNLRNGRVLMLFRHDRNNPSFPESVGPIGSGPVAGTSAWGVAPRVGAPFVTTFSIFSLAAHRFPIKMRLPAPEESRRQARHSSAENFRFPA